MKLNRRNTIIGLGTIVAGGGAALGSGAFSTAEAERGLEVNVVDNANVIAEEFVDIVIDPSDHESITVNGGESVSHEDYEEVDDDGTLGNDAVTLLLDNPEIVFGRENGGDDTGPLLPNSDTEYSDLFVIINDEDETSGDEFNVRFEVDFTGDHELSFDDPDLSSDVEIDSAGTTTVDTTTLKTAGNDDASDGTLTIIINPAE